MAAAGGSAVAVGRLLAQSPGETASEANWSDVIFAGGTAGLMILLVLVALSFAMVYLVIDAVFALRNANVEDPSVTEAIKQCLIAGQIAEADQLCHRHPTVVTAAVAVALRDAEIGYAAAEAAAEASLADSAAALYRRVDLLALVGNVAPMVGLLGTVMGMVMAFRQVANTAGTAGAPDLAEGIYQALVTTVGGLAIAIPALVSHGLARYRIEQLMSAAAKHTTAAIAPLKRRLSRHS